MNRCYFIISCSIHDWHIHLNASNNITLHFYITATFDSPYQNLQQKWVSSKLNASFVSSNEYIDYLAAEWLWEIIECVSDITMKEYKKKVKKGNVGNPNTKMIQNHLSKAHASISIVKSEFRNLYWHFWQFYSFMMFGHKSTNYVNLFMEISERRMGNLAHITHK